MNDGEKYIQEVYAAALERTIRRFWILCIILTILLVGSNAIWIYYESQFEDVVTTESIETNSEDGGDATGIIGNNNEVNNGKSESDAND